MAVKTIKPKDQIYGVIQRGNSLTIPVTIKDTKDLPLDLTEYEIAFTVKPVESDFDREDLRAYIQKNFAPQEPTFGRFYIQLSSKDTDFEPGGYYFDIELLAPDTGMVYRLCTLEFELHGGPTNRTVNDGVGQLPIGNEINIVTIEEGRPVIIIASPVAISAELFSRVDELELKIESHETQIDQLTTQVSDITKELEANITLAASTAQLANQMRLELTKAQNDILALEQKIYKI